MRHGGVRVCLHRVCACSTTIARLGGGGGCGRGRGRGQAAAVPAAAHAEVPAAAAAETEEAECRSAYSRTLVTLQPLKTRAGISYYQAPATRHAA